MSKITSNILIILIFFIWIFFLGSHLINNPPDPDLDLKLSRKQRSASDEGEHVLIDDLKALLELKHQIQTIKEESENQNMGDDIRQIRLQELEVSF